MRKITLFLLFFIILGITSGCWRTSQTTGEAEDANVATANINEAVSPAQLSANYQSQLRAVLTPYWNDDVSTGIKEQILALRTPAQFLDLHLNLVLAFEDLVTAEQQGVAAEITAARNRIEALATEYSWIKIN